MVIWSWQAPTRWLFASILSSKRRDRSLAEWLTRAQCQSCRSRPATSCRSSRSRQARLYLFQTTRRWAAIHKTSQSMARALRRMISRSMGSTPIISPPMPRRWWPCRRLRVFRNSRFRPHFTRRCSDAVAAAMSRQLRKAAATIFTAVLMNISATMRLTLTTPS